MSVVVERLSYTRVAIFLHWAIAALILFNLSFGFFMEGYDQPLRGIAVELHISSGISVLALTVVRVVWRLLYHPPAHPSSMSALEDLAARFVHLLLYVAMVLMPLTGWAIISSHPPKGSAGALAQAAGAPVQHPGGDHFIWGLLRLPSLAPVENIGVTPGGLAPQTVLHDRIVEWHSIGGYIMIALLLLHVAGALKHQFFDKERTFARMGIGKVQPQPKASRA